MKSNLTLVTALFDINRGNLNEGFRRSFDHYLETFGRLLQTELPMTIFCDDEVEEFVWKHRNPENTKVVKKSLDDLKNFPFYEQTNTIRQQREWRERSGWIVDSPQSQLELYNPLVMSKQFFLNDATIFNFFDTKYFLWIDAGIANTIGDPCNYFTLDFSRKITAKMNKMLYVCFPYDGQVEVHGFEKDAFNRFAQTETDRVARGGMFGGSVYAINEINSIYYQLLNNTLATGNMGTEESIFTLITYLHPELCNIQWIEPNGLIIKALEDIKNSIEINDAERLAIYALTFNIPDQFEFWVKSFEQTMPNEFKFVAKYVINNSTDSAVEERYQELFDEYGFTVIEGDLQRKKLQTDGDRNVGICGGRQIAAEHFHESDHEYMIFFEDDMLLHKNESGPCKTGFTTHHPQLFDKCIDIMDSEGLDYLKLSFSEFYGLNNENWAWYNVPQEKKDRYFPPKIDGSNPRSTVVKRIDTHRGLPYAVGEYHYCNWPILFNKNGNKKIFIDERYEHLYEQTWMSHAMNLMRDGELEAGCLLASVINHVRKYHYNGKQRRENEHYKN